MVSSKIFFERRGSYSAMQDELGLVKTRISAPVNNFKGSHPFYKYRFHKLKGKNIVPSIFIITSLQIQNSSNTSPFVNSFLFSNMWRCFCVSEIISLRRVSRRSAISEARLALVSTNQLSPEEKGHGRINSNTEQKKQEEERRK